MNKELIEKDGIMYEIVSEVSAHMFLNKDDAKAAVAEVLKTHDDDVATGSTDFEGTWTHFDVNNDGLVEVERFP